MSADLGFLDDRDAVGAAQWISSSGEQERGDIDVERRASLDMAVVFDINGVTQQGPTIAVVVFDIGARVEQVA
ncbi:hypothetical protein [Phytohabitans kaempferiae]|uniref:Uncharacterized protein n=1 Tax=Phytohabitans kaempferiae TaxID=1620943 RepID=A0ABV6MBL3_9ACTN